MFHERRTDAMSAGIRLVVFGVDEQRYALPLTAVARVVRAVQVTPLPGAPASVLGVIDVAGDLLPVLNLRRRLRLPEREVAPADQFLLARTARRAVALAVDEAHGVIECGQSAVTAAARIAPGLEQIPGVVTLDDGLVLIHDLEKFLSPDEARVVDEAMAGPA